MVIHTDDQLFDLKRIDNRRFLYDPTTNTLVLGKQYRKNSRLRGSHAEELAEAGITEGYDRFVRGWVGTGPQYPHGVIHFAPCVVTENVTLFDRAFDTLEMFAENGALAGTMVRGFGHQWEQPLSNIIGDFIEEREKPSIREALKADQRQSSTHPGKNHSQER